MSAPTDHTADPTTGEAAIDPEQIFSWVKRCLADCVGGSGHLASYTLKEESFELLSSSRQQDGSRLITFRVGGWRLSEFQEALEGVENEPEPPAEELLGSFTLAANGQPQTDDRGCAMISPWKTRWKPGAEEEDLKGLYGLLED